LLPYGLELSLCQRYFERLNPNSNAIGQYGVGGMNSTTLGYASIYWKTRKRANPSVSFASANTFYLWSYTTSNVAASSINTSGTPGVDGAIVQVGISSSGTAGQALILEDGGSGNSYILIDADM
jgi:hypothetical protein